MVHDKSGGIQQPAQKRIHATRSSQQLINKLLHLHVNPWSRPSIDVNVCKLLNASNFLFSVSFVIWFSSLGISAKTMFPQSFDVISHKGKLVRAQMVKVIPCVDPSFMQVIENYPVKQQQQLQLQQGIMNISEKRSLN